MSGGVKGRVTRAAMARLFDAAIGLGFFLASTGTRSAISPEAADAPTQDKLVRNVRAALQADHRLVSSGIQIAASGTDEVILFGRTASERQKTLALRAAAQAMGVRHILDRIAAGPNREEKDIQLEAGIHSRIERDPELGAEDILSVDVISGSADIGGIVDTWEQNRQVTHDAFVAGAQIVINHVRVRRDPSCSERRLVYRLDPFVKGG